MERATAGSFASTSGRQNPSASVVRIPIMDTWNHVQGYELLFWDPAMEGEESSGQCEGAASAYVEVEILSRSLPAFVHCTLCALGEEWVRWLPTKVTVLELDGNDEADDEQMKVLRELRASGYKIALRGSPADDSRMWELADYVKVDAARVWDTERKRLLGRIKEAKAKAIAMHVDTQREFHERQDQGFELFQGSYLLRPEPLPVHKIPPNRMVHLEILEVLQQQPADLERLSQLVKCDASLTYRLLRLVNSPLCALRQEVTSIKSALLLLGEDTARRFATMALAAEFNGDQPSEIQRIAMERARFCEQSATLCGQISSEQYLIGLVSMFPAMLRTEMDEVVKMLPLREQARAALLGKDVPEAALLTWMLRHEQGEWEQCEAIQKQSGMSREQILQRHNEAIAWADMVLFNADLATARAEQ